MNRGQRGRCCHRFLEEGGWAKPPKKGLSLSEAERKRWRFHPPLRRVPMMTMPSHGYRGSSKRNHGYILLELIIGLVLLGVLMPILMHCYQASHGMLQKIAQRNTALQVRHYLQFVLREDMVQTHSLAQIGGDIVLYTDLGEIVYTIEDGVLKRRFSGQTLRLNPDLSLRCLSLNPVSSAMGLRLETTLGAVIVQVAATP
jgi:hypothetical protein